LRGMGSVWGAAMNKFRKSPPEAQVHAATLAVKRRAKLALEKDIGEYIGPNTPVSSLDRVRSRSSS